MPALPGGAVLLHRGEYPIGHRSNPSPVDRRGGFTGGVQGRMHHGVHGLRSAENLGGLVVPGGPLLGQGAGFVFGVAGLQCCLLGEVQQLYRRWWSTMIALKLARQLNAPALDAGPPRRPPTVQGRLDADNLTYRPEPRIAVASFRE